VFFFVWPPLLLVAHKEIMCISEKYKFEEVKGVHFSSQWQGAMVDNA